MPVIDIHEHVVRTDEYVHPDADEGFITADQLVETMDRVGIDQSVVLPMASPDPWPLIQSSQEVWDACEAHKDRFIRFCNVDPRCTNRLNADFVPLLEHFKARGARGLGEMVANLWWDDPRVQCLLRGCEVVGFPVIFHIATCQFNTYGLITEPGLAGLERALQRFPKLTFLGHSQAFWSEVGPTPRGAERGGYPQGKVEEGGAVPRLLREYPNLWADLSAGSGCNALTRDPEWGYRFIEEFQDRLLMGLDLCTNQNALGVGCKLLDFLRDGLAQGRVSQTAFDKIMGGNAVRLLDLDNS